MFAKSKWILAVALVAVLMVSGVVFATGENEKNQDVLITIDEVAELRIMEDKTPAFTVGLVLDSDTPTLGVITIDEYVVEIGYASILPALGGTREITAELSNDSNDVPGGLTLTATASDLGGGPGVYGEEVEDPTALSADGLKPVTAVELITGIGSVSEAKAKITYRLEITKVEDLAAIEESGLEVTLTLTAAGS